MDSRRWASLDVLRGTAAIAVFLFHFYGLATPWSWQQLGGGSLDRLAGFGGSLGTNLLLLLSGFLVGKAEVEATDGYLPQLLKRSVRIYVPYVFWLCAALFMWAMIPSLAKQEISAAGLDSVFKHLILIPGIFSDRPVLTVTWTLSFVFAGYVVLPALASLWKSILAARKSLAWLWLGVIAVVILSSSFLGVGSIRMAYIPMGALLAELVLAHQIHLNNWRQMTAAMLLVIVLLCCRFAIHLSGAAPVVGLILYSLCGLGATSILTLALFSSELILGRRFLSYPSKLLRSVGVRGYSFYLLHGAVTKVTVFAVAAIWNWEKWPLWLVIAVILGCFSLTFAVSSMSCALLEKEVTGLVLSYFRHKARPSDYPLAANWR